MNQAHRNIAEAKAGPEFGPGGALRAQVGEHGRVHLDRWLPFILLHRGDEPADGLARRVAIESPAYLVWSPEDDAAAMDVLDQIGAAAAEAAGGRLLVITLDDHQVEHVGEGTQDLPMFMAEVGAGDQGDVGRAAGALERALHEIEIDLRKCKVSRVPFAPLLPASFDRLLNGIEGVQRLSLRIPQIHRSSDGREFPAIRHELSTRIGDALLRTGCAFLDDGRGHAPAHYRALGRSAYLAAARKADRQLDRIARSFDFLLSVSPIDTAKALDRFIAEGEQKPPRFHYRPLTVDPDIAKRDLYAIDFRQLEDPLLEQLLGEKRHELDSQLTMLATRNTPAFHAASVFQYGTVARELLDDAHAILAAETRRRPAGDAVGAMELAHAIDELSARYRQVDPSFAPDIQVRDDVAGLMVSGPKIFIGSDSVVPAQRVNALLAHEVSIHLLTHFNGAAQGLTIFRTGLAGYEGIQEGLGVFAEWATGGLTSARLRLLAARVVAVDALQQGAGFIEVYRLLNRDHGFSRRGAFGIAARIFRSGGFAKDAIYLRGFRAVLALVAAGKPLAPFWLGKIAEAHVPAIEELLQRGLVQPPRFTPLFLEDDDSSSRIAKLRKAKSFAEMISGE
ncbi:DUF1704 domain-containing protein [Sphingomonas sinipercae]|uniref:DUF1704 domain-containing protein n=1 Tax=Sphingomonas sinipercae TaxID=2714944 RepID=A0A6G7ZKZ3_9SPHN|nr:tyrosine/phenylalanine carboxypeptidase domain-containing protein [Sphingomonas sinipercae]QIL01589.1 DUF1704 domain-containing protein [Sphingomonas sinipercae]